MDCHETHLGDAVLLVPVGRIDLSNAEAFRDGLSAALAKANTAIVVDLSGVDYISSAGLRSLMIVFKAAKSEGKAFAVAALQPLVREIFAISRFDLVFPLFGTVRDAIAELAPGALSALAAR
jgi:anti-anti-sigma factor